MTNAQICALLEHTPFGRFKFRRLPFGICSAPEIFQKKNYELFGDCRGTCIYFDDIIVGGKTLEEHDRNLKMVLEKAREFNVKFNSTKVQFRQNQVKFMGQILSRQRLKPDEAYIKAIVDMGYQVLAYQNLITSVMFCEYSVWQNF